MSKVKQHYQNIISFRMKRGISTPQKKNEKRLLILNYLMMILFIPWNCENIRLCQFVESGVNSK